VFSQITHSQGYIWVAFIVGTSGNVEQAKALEDPDSTIAQAAINAVKKWKFVPGRIDGSPAQLLLTVPVSFQTAN
jgi:TonB family protein